MGSIYQDRRALRIVRNAIMWLASVVAPLPLVRSVSAETLGIAVGGAVTALVAVYLIMWYVVEVRY